MINWSSEHPRIYEEMDISDEVGADGLDKIINNYNNNIMNSNLWRLKVRDVAGACVSAVLSAVLAYLANATSLSALSWEQIGGIALTVGATSLLKSFSTTTDGNFCGLINVK